MNFLRRLIAGTLLVSAVGAAKARAQDTSVALADVPAAVQRAANEAAKGSSIESIRQRNRDGRAVYEIRWQRGESAPERLVVDETGAPLSFDGEAPSITADAGQRNPRLGPARAKAPELEPMINLNTLPPAVRDAIAGQAAGREIVDLDRETWRGRTVYEIEFKGLGIVQQIYFAEDGSVVTATPEGDATAGAKPVYVLMGAQLAHVPEPVRVAVLREAGEAEVKDVDVERHDGQPLYEILIGDGPDAYLLYLSEDGKVLHDSRPADSRGKP